MIKRSITIMCTVGGCILGISGGYFFNLTIIQGIIKNSVNPPYVAQKNILITEVDVHLVDTKNKTMIVSVPDPYNPAIPRTLSVTYDEKSVFVSNNNTPIQPEEFAHSKETVMLINRDTSRLYSFLMQKY